MATATKKRMSIILGVMLIAFMAAAIMLAAPQQAEAKALKTSGTYCFISPKASSSNYATITPTSKKLTIKGSGYFYKSSSYKTIGNNTYTVKLNNSTKYYNAETKTSKSAAFKKLKNKNYIAVYLDVKSGVVKRLTFGA